MTREQYERLKEWDKVFVNAIKINFLHLTYGEFDKIAALYTEILRKDIRPNQRGCNTCRLKIVKELGEVYLQEKKEIAKKEKETAKNEEQTETPKKKTGRPKKIDLD